MLVAMTYSEQAEADEAALKARLLRLRAFTEDIAQRLHGMPAPETYVEATHAARALQTADKALKSLPEAPPQTCDAAPAPTVRDALRACADRLLDAVERIERPQTHLEVARAQRCALTMQALLRQLYKTPCPSGPRRYEDKDFTILFSDWDDATGRDDRLPSDPDFRIENINCIPLPGEEDRDIWEIIVATQDEQQDFDIAEDCGRWPGGARYDPEDRFYNCPRLQHWVQTYGMDYFTPDPP
jgi:hypothetical protein